MTRLADCSWLEDTHLTPLRLGLGMDVFYEGGVVFVWIPGCWAYATVRRSLASALEEALERAVRALAIAGVKRGAAS